MGRPPLYNVAMNLNLDPVDMKRVSAIVGEKGISKFVREFKLGRWGLGYSQEDHPDGL